MGSGCAGRTAMSFGDALAVAMLSWLVSKKKPGPVLAASCRGRIGLRLPNRWQDRSIAATRHSPAQRAETIGNPCRRVSLKCGGEHRRQSRGQSRADCRPSDVQVLPNSLAAGQMERFRSWRAGGAEFAAQFVGNDPPAVASSPAGAESVPAARCRIQASPCEPGASGGGTPRKSHAPPPASHARPTARRVDWLPPHAGGRRRGAASARAGVEGAGDGGPGGHAGESAEFRKASGTGPPLAVDIFRQPRSARDRRRRTSAPAAGLAARLPAPDERLRVRFRACRRNAARNPHLAWFFPGPATRRAGPRRRLHGLAGRITAERVAGLSARTGERHSECRCRQSPLPGMRTGGHRQARTAATRPSFLPVSASRPSRTRPCPGAGSGAMKVPGARCRGCRAAERMPGPESMTRDRTFVEKQPLARPFRRARKRSLRCRIARDS